MKCSLPVDLLCVNMNLSVRCSWTEKWNFCLSFLITQHFQQFLSVCVPNLSPFCETPFWIHERSVFKLQNIKKKTKTWGQDRKPLLLSLWLFDSLLFQAGITLWWCTVCAHTRSRALTFRGGDLTKARLNKYVLCDKLGHLLALSQRSGDL